MKGTRHFAARSTWPWLVSSGLLVALGALGLSAWQSHAEVTGHRADSQEIRAAAAADVAEHDVALEKIHARVNALETERTSMLADKSRLDAELARATAVEQEDRAEAELIAADKAASFEAKTTTKKKPTKKKRTKTKRKPKTNTKPKADKKPEPPAPETKAPGRRIELPESRDPLAGL